MEPRHNVKTSDSTENQDASGSTLLPMLIGGLVLIVLGAIGVMVFV